MRKFLNCNNNSGFTLLELIVVIIIVGVLASLALPQFFSMVEYSRSAEAMRSFRELTRSMERCYVASNETYVGCDFGSLDVDDPANSPGNHFTYVINNQSTTEYTLTATRNTLIGGDGTSTIVFDHDSSGITRSGTGAFLNIK